MFNHCAIGTGDVRSAVLPTAAIRSALPWGAFPLALLLGCASLSPVAPETRVGEFEALKTVLALPDACTMSASDGVAMGPELSARRCRERIGLSRRS